MVCYRQHETPVASPNSTGDFKPGWRYRAEDPSSARYPVFSPLLRRTRAKDRYANQERSDSSDILIPSDIVMDGTSASKVISQRGVEFL